MLTEKQIEELEYQYNYYSFRKEFNEKVGDMEESKINLAKMGALKAVFDALGYKTPWERYDEKCGVKYDYYKLVKECQGWDLQLVVKPCQVAPPLGLLMECFALKAILKKFGS